MISASSWARTWIFCLHTLDISLGPGWSLEHKVPSHVLLPSLSGLRSPLDRDNNVWVIRGGEKGRTNQQDQSYSVGTPWGTQQAGLEDHAGKWDKVEGEVVLDMGVLCAQQRSRHLAEWTMTGMVPGGGGHVLDVV